MLLETVLINEKNIEFENIFNSSNDEKGFELLTLERWKE